jgi:hypothetical protein
VLSNGGVSDERIKEISSMRIKGTTSKFIGWPGKGFLKTVNFNLITKQTPRVNIKLNR